MPNFETKKEVYDYYDEKIEQFAKINDVNGNAMNTIFDIFTSGVTYTDENGELQTTLPLDPEHPKDESDEKRLKQIMRKGMRTIKESTRAGGASQLMMQYARTNGISQSDVIELGSNPSSEKSVAIKKKLEGMKQNYIDLINSEDADKLSDLFLDTFKTFKKECGSLMLNSGKVDSFIKNWPKLIQWNGSSSIIQQSFAANNSVRSENQQKLIDNINKGIKETFGEDLELKDMLALMQPIHKANVEISANKIYSLEAFEENYKNLDASSKSEQRTKIANTFRMFCAAEDFAKRQEIIGKPSHLFSKDAAKAMIMISTGDGYDEFVPDDYDGYAFDGMGYGSDFLVSQMKYMAGDNSCLPIYNIDNMLNFTLVDPNDPLSTCPQPYAQLSYADKKKYNDLLALGPEFSDVISRKVKEKQPLSNEEVTCFLSDTNTRYTDSMKQQVRAFFSMDPSFRMNQLPSELKAVLSTYCNRQLGLTPEEYLSGVLPISKNCEQQYKSQLKDISKHVTGETVNSAYHRQMMGFFKDQMKDISSTFASSKEFVEMEKAFKDLISADPNYPKGREAEYKLKLKALQEKAAKYIEAKQADGKKERSTSRGQKRFNIAKRLEAFASESLNQIQKTEEANLLANIPQERKTSFEPVDFNRRVDEMLAPHAKGSKELMKMNLYTEQPSDKPDVNTYVPDDINLPENCPFSDHDFAMISYAEISNADHFKNEHRYNKYLSDDENSILPYVFRHDDLFIAFRGATKNNIPQFNKVRHSAENLVNEYMKGNPKPLAKSLGHSLKIGLTNLHTFTDVKENMKVHVIAARKTLDMLSKDPKLMKESGITSKEIKEIVEMEAHAKLQDDKELAQKALADGTEKTPQKIDDLYAKIIACDIIDAAELDEMNKSQESPQAQAFIKEFEKLNSEHTQMKSPLKTVENGGKLLSDKERAELQSKADAFREKVNVAYARVENANFYRKISDILERFGDSAGYEPNRKALTTLIKKHPQFEQLKNSIANGTTDKKAFEAVKDYAIKNIGPTVDRHNLRKGLEAEKALTQPENKLRIEIGEPTAKTGNGPVNGL